MKKSLKNKIIIGVPVIFIAVMLVVTVVVSVILSKQNRKAANTLIQNAFSIVRYTISEKQEKLLFDSRQMASIDDMGRKIGYVMESSSYFKYDTLRPTYMRIASVIYSTSTTADVWKANIYNSNGDLMAFTIIEENGSTLGCVHNRETIEIASLKPAEELTDGSWIKQDSLPAGIEYSFGSAILDKEAIHFEIIDNSLCLVAYVPAMGKEYNAETERIEAKQVGMVVTIQKLGTAFVKKMSELSGTDINIFAQKTVLSGTYADYKTFDLSGFADVKSEWTLNEQPVTFNDVDIAGGSYFQGILPIYSDSKCVAAIVSLYSKEMAKANTMQIIKLLSLVYLVGVILIVPITILVVVRGVINPIQRTAFMMRQIAHKKDFTKMLNIESQDEIGDLASSFNEMTENLCKTTTSIDNLNREIAERKKAEDALRKSEEFTRRIIESSDDCIKVLDLEGHLLSMSQGGQKLLEIDDLTPYLNMSFIDFWKGKEREGCLEAIAKAKQGDTGIFYGYFQTVKGRPKWWEIIVTPIKDADGSINRLLAVSRDITERKQAEQHQVQLLEQLEKTNQELKDFAYIVSHDLKAPLRGIKTLAEWITTDYADKLDDNGKEQMNLLAGRVNRMHNLIDGILQYSRIGRIEEEKVVVNLNELVTEAIDTIAPPENITITIENELPTIECEQTRIMQVFQNLLSNAVKYMDKPQGRIEVGCIEENGFWKFSITDNGPGIEERHFEKIFQLFQTLAPRDESESTGIGLTVTKKIVELYNGKIWVESKVGEGSTFFFTLPKQKIGIKDAKLEASIIS
jgi:PAS domain S-box-containing protein